jgi:uncharacterized protein with WD repeat
MVVDFAEARRRIEVLAAEVVEIEIEAARIPVLADDVHELEIKPAATYLEMFDRSLSRDEFAELMSVTLEEVK